MGKLNFVFTLIGMFLKGKVKTVVEQTSEPTSEQTSEPTSEQTSGQTNDQGLLSHLNIGKLKDTGYTKLIVQTCEKFGLSAEQAAYVIATVYHETAGTMKPIEEYGKGKSYTYGNWTLNSKGVKICPKNGSRTAYYTQNECNYLFYGRGFAQLTWYDNYEKIGKLLYNRGYIDSPEMFIETPEKALVPEYSVLILVVGMVEGIFTGKSLNNYINDVKCDFRDARRIINGLDRCDLVASYAKSYIA